MNIRLQRHILLHLLMICIIAPACAQSIAGSSITSRTKLHSRGSKMIEQRVYDNEDGNVIRYRYAADGRKVTAEYITPLPATTKRVDYCSNMVYEDHRAKMLTYDGGFVLFDDSTLPHCSYIKDHLGNNRMLMHPSGSVIQTNNYYPFGGLMSNSTGWNLQKYKYNGKELDRMYGLDWYDYGARWLAPDLCRWLTMDPLCEKYYDYNTPRFSDNRLG